MADIETLGILDEIQALVSDKLQVVSYKWLSRNFLVPSNTAKRLLQEFVEKNGSQLEVVYSLSGWLKNNPSVYHIMLVSGSKLSEAKEEFGGSCSIQVYSVQTCIPKDPALLWNAEFIQTEELFKEPPDVVNCLRDNRFCGVLNSFVERNASKAAPLLRNAGIYGPSRTTSNQTSDASLRQQIKVEKSDTNAGRSKDIQSGNHQAQALEKEGKQVANKERVPQFPINKKKAQNDKASSGTAGSLASMWGRASTKPKSESASVKSDDAIHTSNDAQIHANESVEDESSDDDDQQMNFKRASNGEGNNRKRKVVFDFSDEDDNAIVAVNLASPDPPKKQVPLDPRKSSKSSGLENKNLDFDEQKEDEMKVKKENVSDVDHKLILKEGNDRKIQNAISNENQCPDKDDENQKDKTSDAAQNVLKKRKVLKTRIDERGREVTEVVWENDEKETKLDDNTRKDKGNSNTSNNVVNRPPAAAPKKSPAVGNATSHATGKAGNKKAGTKNPKQGNIMSFFKKV